MHVIAAKAVAFGEALQPEFKDYQQQIINNAQALAKGFLSRGFRLVSGGTDNHLVLLDMRSKALTGKVAEKILDDVGITVNKNTIPFDPESPFVTSGIRIGSPAVTSRGMKEAEMDKITEAIDLALTAKEDREQLKKAEEIIADLCSKFPLYN